MFSLIVFKCLIAIPVAILGMRLILWFINVVLNAIIKKAKRATGRAFSKKTIPIPDVFKRLNTIVIVSSCFLAIVIFVLASVVPYMAQESDHYLISYYNKNIFLLRNYIKEYSENARKQIEEYQKLQAEMARIATSTQLQFWSKQQDRVGDSLTDSIKTFKDEIRQNQVDINKATARIQRRPKNKFFFGLD